MFIRTVFISGKSTKMRKRIKKKKRSCKLCKPWKMAWSNRWKDKELARLKEYEKQKKEFLHA